jgi:hypothetical protein
MSSISGEQLLATILKHDNKTTSYKIALLRAINDVVLLYPEVVRQGQVLGVTARSVGVAGGFGGRG